MALLRELNDRGVVRAAALYVAIAWGGTEILVFLIEALQGEQASGPVRKYLAILFIAGFPVAMYLAWTRDLGLRARRVVAAGAMAAVLVAALIWLTPNSPMTTGDSAPQFANVDPKSIAVLPFVNMSGDEDNTYFSHGMSEELLNVLTRVPGLKVSSRTSSFYFAGRDVSLRDIAAQLAVRHILEGSVRKSGNNVRITAQLIDAKTDTHLWSETYDRKVLDTFAVQGEIAAEIVDELQLNLISPIRSARPTENEEAFDKYLRGWHFMRVGWGRDELLSARKYFSEATELDPEFAQAHALLSMTETSLGNFRHLAPKDVFPTAQESALTALALDDTSPEAHIAMGWLALSYQFDWKKAEAEFRRAIELAPGNFIGYNGLSFALQTGGQLDEALTASKRVFELDPMMIWSRNGQAEVYLKQHEYDAGLEQALVMLEMQPDDPLMHAWVGSLYVAKGMHAKALEYGRRAERLGAGDPTIELMLAGQHAQLGNESKARKLLAQALARRDSKFVSPGTVAIVYTHLGEHDVAIDWLYVAVDEFDSFIFNLNYPDFDALRSEPRFIELCDQLRMPCAETWGEQ
ncbi:MAG: tetratricopeptide repeat protein [Woeseiaceae bacterium]|nr:tetratricopeptide repeat protein [Woeseiaceae bacterium]